jgi:hypothetical protein
VPGLDSAFYPALWNLCLKVQTRPEVFLIVWAEESGLNPGAINSVGCTGLNQSCPSGPPTYGPGFPTGYEDWPASQQVSQWITQQVVTSIGLNKGPFLSAARALQANLLPATLATATTPSAVICGKAGPYASAYAGNSQFDVDKSGTITLQDLGDYLQKMAAGAHFGNLKSAIATAYAQAPAGAPWSAPLADPYHEPGSAPGPTPPGKSPPLPVASRGGPPVLALATIGGAIAAVVALAKTR